MAKKRINRPLTAEGFARGILKAIEDGHLNKDALIALAEEVRPGMFRFLGTPEIKSLPGEEKTTVYLVAKG